MTKLEHLTKSIEEVKLQYIDAEQIYINNYYYNHEKSMQAYDEMNGFKEILVRKRALAAKMRAELNIISKSLV